MHGGRTKGPGQLASLSRAFHMAADAGTTRGCAASPALTSAARALLLIQVLQRGFLRDLVGSPLPVAQLCWGLSQQGGPWWRSLAW